jgi:hypothetical protein
MRTCIKCGEEKSEVRFYSSHEKQPNGQTWLRYRSKCKECTIEERKLINNNEYERILLKQNGVCAICDTKPNGKKLHIDHRHSLGVKKKGGGYVRGLLCSNCNTSLGLLKDNINNLKKAIKYIMFHEKNPNFHKLKYSSSYFIKAKKMEERLKKSASNE